MSDGTKLKYRKVDSRGQTQGFLASKGVLRDTGLELVDGPIASSRFVRAEARDRRVVVWLKEESGGNTPHVFEFYSPKPAEFARAFNRIASDTFTLTRQEALEAHGRGSELRVRRCTACDGMIDRTDFPETPEAYCPFCDTVSHGSVPAKEQEKIRICDSCGYFSMPRTITCFYFYFLLVLYGFRWQKKHMCSPCMRAEGWKMLAGNLVFVLGVPVAMTQLGRAYFGGTALSGAYCGLEGANVVAKARKPEEAAKKYAEIAARLGGSAVSSFNAGLAFASAQRLGEAQQAFEASLRRCSNFGPAADMLAKVLQAQGKEPRDSAMLAGFFQRGNSHRQENADAESVAATDVRGQIS